MSSPVGGLVGRPALPSSLGGLARLFIFLLFSYLGVGGAALLVGKSGKALSLSFIFVLGWWDGMMG
jgi:hypothetical protein